MFRWVFETDIQAPNGAFGLTRKVDLPFMPVAGMQIGDVFCWGSCVTVESFVYYLDGPEFRIREKRNNEDWDRDFTIDDVREFMSYGCEVDERTDPDVWLAERIADLKEDGATDA